VPGAGWLTRHNPLSPLLIPPKTADRQGRVYLDYLQNGSSKTLAVAYCVRPYPKATVSTPLKWSEVKRGLDPTKFTMQTLPRRVDKIGDLWRPVLGPGIDLSACLARLASRLRTQAYEPRDRRA